MKKRKCYLFVFDGYADWEPALAIASLNKYSDFSIHTFSKDGQAVRSMGEVQVLPDVALKDVNSEEPDLLILPGGEVWEKGGHDELEPLVSDIISKNKDVAAICGATVFMGRHGYLDSIRHTSNGLNYLQNLAPEYKGEKLYQNKPCVADGNIITANGAGMIEFAIEIFRKNQLMDEPTLEKIYDLYKSGGMNNRLYMEASSSM